MEESECIICFSQYDDEEYRPRSMPCGHTLCSKCLERAIREESKSCPKCRTIYSASNVKELPVNFSLESVVKSINISEKLPICTGHQLPVRNRCSTHKAWLCQSCLKEDHSLESCKIITIREEMNIKKSTQLDQSLPLLKTFEEACKKSDDYKNQCKKLIEDNDEEIIRLQEEIKKRKAYKLKMVKTYDMFDKKLDILKGKKRSYDNAVTSLKRSESIEVVSRYSLEVHNEAQKLQLISQEIEIETDIMIKAFKFTEDASIGKNMGSHKFSVNDGRYHLHALQGMITFHSPPHNFQFSDENIPPLTDGIETFLDIALSGLEPRRVYIKMLGNTARARQHLLMVTGQCGVSYRDMILSKPAIQRQPLEFLLIRPQNCKDSMPLLKDVSVNDDVSHAKKAGLMFGATYAKKNNNLFVGVYLTDDPGKINKAVFAQVIRGIEVFEYIAKCNNNPRIKIVDCGVVLSW